MLEVKGSVPTRPIKKSFRVRDLTQGQLAVIVEAGDYFGFHVLMTEAGDDSGRWIVCLNDATIPCKVEVWDCICRLVKSPDKVTLVNQVD